MVSYILELLYPSLCPICQQGVDALDTLCSPCMLRLPRTEHQLLRENNIEMLFNDINRARKQWNKPRFVRGGAWLRYNDDIATIVHAGKFYERPILIENLARTAAKEWLESGFFDGIDLLVPVPIHPRRIRERGYNQSEYICKGLASVLHVPFDNTTLIRVKDTKKQSQLSDAERQTNVEHAFRITEPIHWHNKHILLVDDVITTGATIRNCIREITPIRSCQISVFSLAIAR